MSGCASGKQKTDDEATDPETEIKTETELPGEFSFADLENIEFFFFNGIGGWGTRVHIAPDGKFLGEFKDSGIGNIDEGYPNGIVYRCDFKGQLTQPEKVNEYTYSVKIQEMNYEREAGTEEIKEGVLYRYSDAYGLEDAENILIYLPGAPLAELSEEFRYWIMYSSELTYLPYYALNNEAKQYGFSSSDIAANVKALVDNNETYVSSMENSIANDTLTQAELNEITGSIYENWDGALNEVWYYLTLVKSDEEMQPILKEQREWVIEKEREVEAAGAEFEGGTMQPMIMNNKAAEMTKERVYELIDLFDKEGK